MKRSYEEICRESFDLFLSINYSAIEVSWTEVVQEDEPPDWYIEFGEKKYAVEATSLVDQLPELGPKISSTSVSFSLHNLVKEVEEIARLEAILNGAYLIELAPIPNFNQHREWFRDAFVQYIRETCDMPEADRKEFGKIGHSNVSIVKFKSERTYVSEMISFGTKSGHDISCELKEMVTTAVEKKAQLLKNIANPIILLLLDSYGYSEKRDWHDAISRIEIPLSFHTICRVSRGEPSEVLYSKGEF
jgi:hypothetical protein